MKPNLLLLLVLGMYGTVLQAQQQVVATSGNTAKNSSGSVSWTLGEPVIVTLTANNKVLSQGFQQGNVKNAQSIDQKKSMQASIWPNPVHGNLTLTVDNIENVKYQLFDTNSKILLSSNLTDNPTIIDFSKKNSGTYLLKVLRGKTEEKTFTIIKQ